MNMVVCHMRGNSRGGRAHDFATAQNRQITESDLHNNNSGTRICKPLTGEYL
jgi:hypothetical protein